MLDSLIRICEEFPSVFTPRYPIPRVVYEFDCSWFSFCVDYVGPVFAFEEGPPSSPSNLLGEVVSSPRCIVDVPVIWER